MRFTSIGSGSSGNSTLIIAGNTRLLVDVGLSARETVRRLRDIGQEPSQLTAIVITHEHADHVGGMPVLAKQTGVPVYIAPATRSASNLKEKDDAQISWAEPINSSVPFEIGTIRVTPVSVPHDAADPMIFTFEADGVKIAVVTDLGYIPQHVAHRLRGCQALLLEANHDSDMLKIGPYPWALKQRIASRRGHLSNHEMARFLKEDFDGLAEYIILAHLSESNNHPEIARLSALQALQQREPLFSYDWEHRVKIAEQKTPMPWIEL